MRAQRTDALITGRETVASSLAVTLGSSGDYPATRSLVLNPVPLVGFPTLPASLLGWYWSWQALIVDQTGTRFANTERRSIKIES